MVMSCLWLKVAHDPLQAGQLGRVEATLTNLYGNGCLYSILPAAIFKWGVEARGKSVCTDSLGEANS